MLAIASNRRVPTGNGTWQVDVLAAALPARSWQRCPPVPARTVNGCTPGRGSRSPARDRAFLGIVAPQRHQRGDRLLPHLLAAPGPAVGTLVRVAGQRWRVEECFQTSKGLTGLDQHQVRRWTSWHRWVTLAMLAHAFLTVITAAERAADPPPTG